jgi:malate dehydrogenase
MASLAVIGVGRIGGEVAFLAASLGLVDTLVLYDTVPALLKAQVLDLRHTGLDIAISTEPGDIREADICVFTAGLPRDPSVKTRADLLESNLKVIRDCTSLLSRFSGVLVTVTNPMDINNFYLCRKSGMERERCIGFGGQLDSTRFSLALKARGITGSATVLGEHGEHQVPLFSSLDPVVGESRREEILTELRTASMEVIRGKGGTVFGPAYHLAHLVGTIVADSRELLPTSAVLEGEYGFHGCSLGVPSRIGRNGILRIEEWQLDPWEQAHMDAAGKFSEELCRRAVSPL